MPDTPPAILELARRTARANLKLRDARALFDAIYRADALILAGNSIGRAAKLAGVNREALMRQRRQDEIGD